MYSYTATSRCRKPILLLPTKSFCSNSYILFAKENFQNAFLITLSGVERHTRYFVVIDR